MALLSPPCPILEGTKIMIWPKPLELDAFYQGYIFLATHFSHLVLITCSDLVPSEQGMSSKMERGRHEAF